jgi:MscS family membrane protein
MIDFFQQFWELNTKDNTIYYVVAIIVATLLIAKFLSKSIANIALNLLVKAGRVVYRDSYFRLLVKPLQRFIVWCIIIFALDKLQLPDSFNKFQLLGKVNLGQILQFVSITVIVIVFLRFILSIITYIAYKLEQKANLTPNQDDNQLIVFFKDFFKVILIIIGFLLVLKYGLHQHIGNLLTGLSIVGAAIALATKESLENLIASFIIFFDKPFVTGDELHVQNVNGTVEKIGLRSTRIRTSENTYVTVPNKQMVDSAVDNHSLRTKRKVTISIALAGNTTTIQLQQIKTAISIYLQKLENALNHHIYIQNITNGTIVMQIDYTLESIVYADFMKSKDSANFAIIAILETNNVQLAMTK